MINNEKIAAWAGYQKTIPLYDVYCDEWYGDNGVLEKIEKRGLAGAFTRQLAREVNEIGIAAAIINGRIEVGEVWNRLWPLINHSPAQLAAALLRVIEREEDKKTFEKEEIREK